MPNRRSPNVPSRRSASQQKRAGSATRYYYAQFMKRGGVAAAPGAARADAASGNSGGSSGGSTFGNAASTAWNYGGKQVLNPVANTLSGLGTTATGIATLGGAGAGATIGLVGRGIGEATDALGLTTTGGSWWKGWQDTMNEGLYAGATDTLGGAADTLTFGGYDYDGSSLLDPKANERVTSTEQMRSQHRDQLGRGSTADLTYRGLNLVSDFAGSTALAGGAGRGLNMAAKAVKAAPAAAPLLNAASKAPVVGRPLAAAGNWTAGPAPAYNMFTQTAPQYASALMQRGFMPGAAATGAWRAGAGGAALTAAGVVDDVARTTMPMANEAMSAAGLATMPDRVQLNKEDQAYADMQQAQFYDDTEYVHQLRDGHRPDVMAEQMMNDPAIQRRIAHGALPQDAAAHILKDTPEYQAAPPEAQAGAAANAPAIVGDMQWQNTQQDVQAGISELQQLTNNPDANPEQIRTTTNNTMRTILTGAPQETVDSARKFLEDSVGAQLPPTPEAPAAATAATTSTAAPSATTSTATTPAASPAGEPAPAKPMSPEAKQFQDQALDAAVASAQETAPPEVQQNPTAFGEYIGQVVDQFQKMPPEAQAAIGLGLPLALAGVFMGGGAGTLMGLLGLAGAAGGAAYAGMLGEDAQQMVGQFVPGGTRGVGNMMAAAGRAMGHDIPEQADLSLLYKPEEGKELNPLARVQEMTNPLAQLSKINLLDPSSWSAADNKDVGAELKKLDQLKLLADRPDWQAIPIMMSLDPKIKDSEQAQQALQQARLITTAANDPKQPLYRQIQGLRQYADAQQKDREKKSLVALKIASRCWKGYEPVPGAKPYSRGSCRPKGSKKTQKAMKKS